MTRSLTSLAVAVAVAVSGATFAPAAASAGESQAVGRYRVQARVPVACWVRPSGAVLAGGGLSGSVVEACNAPGGFTVRASYRPLGELEKARLSYAGRLIDLSKSGEQDLRRSGVATIRSVNYRFEDVDLAEPLILSLTIQPL